MSSSERHHRRLRPGILCLLVLLSACGFRPLYGGAEGEATGQALSAVAIETPKTRIGWELRDWLWRELTPEAQAVEPRYRLVVQLERQRDALLVQLDDSITRYELAISARYDLVDIAQNRVVLRSAARRVASFNVVRAPFADLAAERDAEARAAAELARAIRNRLALFFADPERQP